MQQVALVDYDYANNLQIGPLIHRRESNNARAVGQQHFQGFRFVGVLRPLDTAPLKCLVF
jgi:hypothetical protein